VPQTITPEPLAVTPGTAVPSTTTIDALFTAVFATRNGAASSAPAYVWNTAASIMGYWSDGSAMFAWFEARPLTPSVLTR
jgi:hypothetical protein